MNLSRDKYGGAGIPEDQRQVRNSPFHVHKNGLLLNCFILIHEHSTYPFSYFCVNS